MPLTFPQPRYHPHSEAQCLGTPYNTHHAGRYAAHWRRRGHVCGHAMQAAVSHLNARHFHSHNTHAHQAASHVSQYYGDDVTVSSGSCMAARFYPTPCLPCCPPSYLRNHLERPPFSVRGLYLAGCAVPCPLSQAFLTF